MMTMSTIPEDSECFVQPQVPVSFGWKIFICAVYAMTWAFGISINAMVIHVQFKSRVRNPMRWILINLSGSHLMMAVFCVPFTFTTVMNGMWVFPDILCPVSQFVQLLSVSITLFTLCAIAIARYFSVVNMFSKISKWMSKRSVLMLCIIWLVGGLYPSLYQWLTNTHAIPIVYKNQTYKQCEAEQVSELTENVIMLYDYFFTYILPFLIIALTSIFIALAISRTASSAQANRPDEHPIRTVGLMVIGHGLCWTPIKAYHLAEQYTSWWDCMSEAGFYTTVVVYFVAHWMAMMHIIINPVVYCFFSEGFRNNCKRTWPYCLLFRNEPVQMAQRPVRPRRTPGFTSDETQLEVVPPTTPRILADYGNDPDIPFIDDDL